MPYYLPPALHHTNLALPPRFVASMHGPHHTQMLICTPSFIIHKVYIRSASDVFTLIPQLHQVLQAVSSLIHSDVCQSQSSLSRVVFSQLMQSSILCNLCFTNCCLKQVNSCVSKRQMCDFTVIFCYGLLFVQNQLCSVECRQQLH